MAKLVALSLPDTINRWMYSLPAGSARRAALPVLFLLTGRFMGFSPRKDRLGLALSCMNLWKNWKYSIKLNTKLRLYQTYVVPVLLHGCEVHQMKIITVQSHQQSKSLPRTGSDRKEDPAIPGRTQQVE